MTVEYRLVVDKGHSIQRYPKRDLAHAEKGVEDSVRDFQRQKNGYLMRAWVETREVTEWEKL